MGQSRVWTMAAAQIAAMSGFLSRFGSRLLGAKRPPVTLSEGEKKPAKNSVIGRIRVCLGHRFAGRA